MVHYGRSLFAGGSIRKGCVVPYIPVPVYRYGRESMPRTHRLALALVLTALVLAGCDRGGGQSSNPPSSTFPTVPSILVNSTMQNPGGIAAGYGKLTLVALDPSDGSVRWRYSADWHPYQ